MFKLEWGSHSKSIIVCHEELHSSWRLFIAALLTAAATEVDAAATSSPAASVSTTVAPSAFMASTAAAAPTVGAIAMAESYCYS